MCKMSNSLISIVIVSAGFGEYIWSLLPSIENQSHAPIETLVIDNSLKPEFSQKISRYYSKIKLYSSPRNLFYCDALNRGIDSCAGDFILCLNDDVILDRKFIEMAISGFFVDAKVGMVSGKILRSNGQILDSTGLFLTPWCTAKERGYGVPDQKRYNTGGYIFGVNGAVAFYRKKMLDDIKLDSGYFDADYHIFYEDLDIAWRGQNFGWKAYYVPEAVAYHVRGATVRSGQGLNRPYARRYLNNDLHLDLVKNRYLTLIKNETVFNFILHLPFIFFYDLAVWIYILFSKPILIKRLISNLAYLNSAFKKRIIIQKRIFQQK